MAQYISSYSEYINSVVNASEHRLILQKSIRDIKVKQELLNHLWSSYTWADLSPGMSYKMRAEN